MYDYVCLSLSACLSVCLSLSACLFVCLCRPVCLSLSACLSVCSLISPPVSRIWGCSVVGMPRHTGCFLYYTNSTFPGVGKPAGLQNFCGMKSSLPLALPDHNFTGQCKKQYALPVAAFLSHATPGNSASA